MKEPYKLDYLTARPGVRRRSPFDIFTLILVVFGIFVVVSVWWIMNLRVRY